MSRATLAIVLPNDVAACGECGTVVERERLRYYTRRLGGGLVFGDLFGVVPHRAPCGLLCCMSPATDGKWRAGDGVHVKEKCACESARLTNRRAT